jgi:hypothetical protein
MLPATSSTGLTASMTGAAANTGSTSILNIQLVKI